MHNDPVATRSVLGDRQLRVSDGVTKGKYFQCAVCWVCRLICVAPGARLIGTVSTAEKFTLSDPSMVIALVLAARIYALFWTNSVACNALSQP